MEKRIKTIQKLHRQHSTVAYFVSLHNKQKIHLFLEMEQVFLIWDGFRVTGRVGGHADYKVIAKLPSYVFNQICGIAEAILRRLPLLNAVWWIYDTNKNICKTRWDKTTWGKLRRIKHLDKNTRG